LNDDPRNIVLDEPRYLLGDAAAAAGIDVNLAKSWVSREPTVIPLGEHDRKAFGKGSSRVFTLRRILSFAIAAEFVRLGLPASQAGLLAYLYTDAKVPDFETGKDTSEYQALKPDTLLVVYPDQEGGLYFVSGDEDPPIRELLERSRPPSSEPSASCAVVSYGAILERVTAALAARGKEVT
jgi:hypothetical protein